ncbi:MAG TPA: hypothetical protein VLT45_02635 [Kofleriaceae bacterium]|nr:hypothetical protein [Kofleriaceae bacterium]
MRKVLFATAVTLLPFLAGCPGFCGGFSGGSDKVYAHASDSLIICSNGGFVASLASGSIEGRLVSIAPATAGDTEFEAHRGETGDLEFRLIETPDDVATTPELGNEQWTLEMLDATALDHADVLCQDLETRAWWTAH